LKPAFASSSDFDVDRFLKANAPFRVHCPPRADVNFIVACASLRQIGNGHPAAVIVGRVGPDPISVIVMDRASLDAFPTDCEHLRVSRRHHCREGRYDMVAGVVADNVVLVIGTAPAGAMERLIDAYGTYHES
jgi:hypothetical protein